MLMDAEKYSHKKPDPSWRKSRIAAKIILRDHRGLATLRDRRIAALLAKDAGVTARLVDQALSGFSRRYKMTYEQAVALCTVESIRPVANSLGKAVGLHRTQIGN